MVRHLFPFVVLLFIFFSLRGFWQVAGYAQASSDYLGHPQLKRVAFAWLWTSPNFAESVYRLHARVISQNCRHFNDECELGCAVTSFWRKLHVATVGFFSVLQRSWHFVELIVGSIKWEAIFSKFAVCCCSTHGGYIPFRPVTTA